MWAACLCVCMCVFARCACLLAGIFPHTANLELIHMLLYMHLGEQLILKGYVAMEPNVQFQMRRIVSH